MQLTWAVEDFADQCTVRRVRAPHAAGHSLRVIARKVLAEGHRARSAGRWHPEVPRQVLVGRSARVSRDAKGRLEGGSPRPTDCNRFPWSHG